MSRRSLMNRVSNGLAMLAVASVMSLGTTHGPALAQEKVLTVGNSFPAFILDPGRSAFGLAGTFMLPAYEPLVRTKADGMFEPALATSWEVSADSKSVTFKLRDNAKFSDGEPVTAAAAKRSIEYWAASKGPLATNLATLASIDVVDDLTFRVNLSQPNPAIVSIFDAFRLAGDLMSPKALDKPESLQTQTYGAGPYMLDPKSTVTGRTYGYIPNPHYYDPSRIYWDKILITVFEDSNSAIQAMQTGQLKMFVSDPLTGHTNKPNLPADLRIVSSPLQVATLYLMDRKGETTPALADVKVRQAINYALDRKLIAQALFGDLGEPTAQLQSRGFVGYDEANENVYPYDIAKAKALLAEAGYANGFELKVGYVNNTQSSMLFDVLSGQLAEVGITVKPFQYVNVGASQEAFRNKEIDSAIFNYTSGIPNLTTPAIFDLNAIYNPYKAEDAQLKSLLEKARALPVDQSADAWKAVFARAVEIAWFAPIAATHQTYFASKSIAMPEPGASIIVDLVNVKPAGN